MGVAEALCRPRGDCMHSPRSLLAMAGPGPRRRSGSHPPPPAVKLPPQSSQPDLRISYYTELMGRGSLRGSVPVAVKSLLFCHVSHTSIIGSRGAARPGAAPHLI